MGNAVVTGAASGIGRAVCRQLETQGDRVVGIDLKGVEIDADLSTRAGREAAIAESLERTGASIDRLVVAAGLGGHIADAALVLSVNYFGAVEVLDGLRPAMAGRPGAAAVAVCSNSAQLGVDPQSPVVQAMLADDEAKARELVADAHGSGVYGASKHALSRAVRRRASEWGECGVRLNGIAPGQTETPLLQGSAAHPTLGKYVDRMPVPLGRRARPDEMAALIVFLLSDASSFVHGAILWADGGTDAVQRPDDF